MDLTEEQQNLIALGAQIARDDERTLLAQRISKLIEAANATELPQAFIAGLESALQVMTHASSSDQASKDLR